MRHGKKIVAGVKIGQLHVNASPLSAALQRHKDHVKSSPTHIVRSELLGSDSFYNSTVNQLEFPLAGYHSNQIIRLSDIDSIVEETAKKFGIKANLYLWGSQVRKYLAESALNNDSLYQAIKPSDYDAVIWCTDSDNSPVMTSMFSTFVSVLTTKLSKIIPNFRFIEISDNQRLTRLRPSQHKLGLDIDIMSSPLKYYQFGPTVNSILIRQDKVFYLHPHSKKHLEHNIYYIPEDQPLGSNLFFRAFKHGAKICQPTLLDRLFESFLNDGFLVDQKTGHLTDKFYGRYQKIVSLPSFDEHAFKQYLASTIFSKSSTLPGKQSARYSNAVNAIQKFLGVEGKLKKQPFQITPLMNALGKKLITEAEFKAEAAQIYSMCDRFGITFRPTFTWVDRSRFSGLIDEVFGPKTDSKIEDQKTNSSGRKSCLKTKPLDRDAPSKIDLALPRTNSKSTEALIAPGTGSSSADDILNLAKATEWTDQPPQTSRLGSPTSSGCRNTSGCTTSSDPSVQTNRKSKRKKRTNSKKSLQHLKESLRQLKEMERRQRGRNVKSNEKAKTPSDGHAKTSSAPRTKAPFGLRTKTTSDVRTKTPSDGHAKTSSAPRAKAPLAIRAKSPAKVPVTTTSDASVKTSSNVPVSPALGARTKTPPKEQFASTSKSAPSKKPLSSKEKNTNKSQSLNYQMRLYFQRRCQGTPDFLKQFERYEVFHELVNVLKGNKYKASFQKGCNKILRVVFTKKDLEACICRFHNESDIRTLPKLFREHKVCDSIAQRIAEHHVFQVTLTNYYKFLAGVSVFGILIASTISVPLGLSIVLFAMYKTWAVQQKFQDQIAPSHN